MPIHWLSPKMLGQLRLGWGKAGIWLLETSLLLPKGLTEQEVGLSSWSWELNPGTPMWDTDIFSAWLNASLYLFIFDYYIIIANICRHNVIFQNVYNMYKDQTRVTVIFIISNIYNFFLLGIFKILLDIWKYRIKCQPYFLHSAMEYHVIPLIQLHPSIC